LHKADVETVDFNRIPKGHDMTKNILAAVALSVATLGVAAPAAHAMEAELNALTGAVFNGLRGIGVDTDGILDLSLQQIVELNFLLSGDSMSETQKANEARKIISGN